MKTTGRTILITGGASGIGFEIARLLSTENKVIIVGRHMQKLQRAAAELPGVVTIQVDITKEDDVNRLVDEVNSRYSDLSVLVNNAGFAHAYTLGENADARTKAIAEFETNYFSPIRLTEKILPFLKKQAEAAIVNVTSAVALTPWVAVPTYSDSKAALHSYTQVLRHELRDTGVKVFELMPPLVDTPFAAELGGQANGMSAADVAAGFLKAFKEDLFEIPVGGAVDLYNGFFAGTKDAFNALNRLG
jgi:uncharacterized oxidoreductase